MTHQPRCQRRYRNGRPCQQAERYHEPSPGASPACWRHLTHEERELVGERAAAALALGTGRYMSEGNIYLTWDIPVRTGGQSDHEYLHAFHAGRCAWCGRSDEPLVQDHDHRSELLRGLLCDSCNKAEAVYGREIRRPEVESPHAWDLYRRVPPAELLGIRIQYANDKRCRCGCQSRAL